MIAAMRQLAWAIALIAAACGSSNKQGGKDGAGSGDGALTIDAPALPVCANPVHGTTMSVRSIGRVSGSAILATSPPVDPRLFVIEQGGGIRIFANETLVSTPFLDIASITGKNLTAGG